MRFAIVENDKVVNVAIADAPIADNWIASDTALIGQLYDGSVFSDAPPDVDAEWSYIRAQRNALLAASDWTQLPNVPVDSAAWEVYRQALRDITTQADPFNIIWPTKPE